MADERDGKINKHAYDLWEKGGRPQGQDIDHWLEAERQIDAASQAVSQGKPAQEAPAQRSARQNEGEGNRTAARAYNRETKAFADSGKAAQKANEASKALDGPEGRELRRAEKIGRSHSHGEDPLLKQ